MMTYLWRHWKVPFSQVEREFRIHFRLVSKFSRFKSSWLQCVGSTVREGVQLKDTWLVSTTWSTAYRLRTRWTKLDHAAIAAAVHQWRRRLSVSVKAGAGHSEHCFFAAITSNLSCCRWPVEELHANEPVCSVAVVSMTLCFAIHGDCWIRKVKYSDTNYLVEVDFCCFFSFASPSLYF